MRKPVYAICENKGSDQTVHPHSLVSIFFVHCFDSIIPIVAKTKVPRLSLVSVVEQTGLSLTWSHTAARLKLNWS